MRAATFAACSDLWAAEIETLERDEPVELAATKGGATLGTYVQPCIQLKLLLDQTPLAVPFVGQQVAQARRAALGANPIVDAIFQGPSTAPLRRRLLHTSLLTDGWRRRARLSAISWRA